LKIMNRLTATAPATPVWTSLEAAVRHTFRTLTAPAAEPSVFEALESEQARIRQSARMWLVG
jgi:hypothetical protein